MGLPKLDDKRVLLAVEKDNVIRSLFCEYCLSKHIKPVTNNTALRIAVREFCDYMMNYLVDAYEVDD